MTYDHNKGSGLPNAPYDWVKEVMSSLATVCSITVILHVIEVD